MDLSITNKHVCVYSVVSGVQVHDDDIDSHNNAIYDNWSDAKSVFADDMWQNVQ